MCGGGGDGGGGGGGGGGVVFFSVPHPPIHNSQHSTVLFQIIVNSID